MRAEVQDGVPDIVRLEIGLTAREVDEAQRAELPLVVGPQANTPLTARDRLATLPAHRLPPVPPGAARVM